MNKYKIFERMIVLLGLVAVITVVIAYTYERRGYVYNRLPTDLVVKNGVAYIGPLYGTEIGKLESEFELWDEESDSSFRFYLTESWQDNLLLSRMECLNEADLIEIYFRQDEQSRELQMFRGWKDGEAVCGEAEL